MVVHQPTLGPVDRLAGLEPRLEVFDVAFQRGELGEAAERDLDRRDEVALLERLDQVGERAGVAGLLDELPLGERGDHEHGSQPFARDWRAAERPSRPGILMSRITRSGRSSRTELDRLVAPPGLAHDVVALLFEELLEVEADDGLVLRDHDTSRAAVQRRQGGSGN